MMHLIRLELKKIKLGWYLRGAIIASVIIAGMVLLIGFVEKSEGGTPFIDFEESIYATGILVRGPFIIFSAVLIAKFIIYEYKLKTITVMYTYPINRRKLMIAKLIVVAGLTLVTTILAHAFVVFIFFAFNHYFQFMPGQPSFEFFVRQGFISFIIAVGTTGTGLIPLYFGMRKHSVPATIVSGIIVVMLISSYNSNGGQVGAIVFVSLALAIIGLLVASSVVRKVDKEDVR